MKISKNGNIISTVGEWFQYAPPKRGEKQWKDNRSAKELARYWTERTLEGASEPIRRLLQAAFEDVTLEEAWPECRICIDSFPGEHRNCDLVVRARSSVAGEIRIHIEAKAYESFGDKIGPYYDKKLQEAQSNLPARMRKLVRDVLKSELTEEIRALRYQLLHSTYAACLDAERAGAKAAILLVHEFDSASAKKAEMKKNEAAWKQFLAALPELRDLSIENEKLYGPVQLPCSSMPLYFGKWSTYSA
jgi:hypothetical protein